MISLFIAFLLPPIGLALSSLALNIYERYENPGVRDRYILAKTIKETIKETIKWSLIVLVLISAFIVLFYLMIFNLV